MSSKMKIIISISSTYTGFSNFMFERGLKGMKIIAKENDGILSAAGSSNLLHLCKSGCNRHARLTYLGTRNEDKQVSVSTLNRCTDYNDSWK